MKVTAVIRILSCGGVLSYLFALLLLMAVCFLLAAPIFEVQLFCFQMTGPHRPNAQTLAQNLAQTNKVKNVTFCRVCT